VLKRRLEQFRREAPEVLAAAKRRVASL